MQIVCPNCTTSYAVDPAKLGPQGRTVRCSRCQESWVARAEDAMEMAFAEDLARTTAAARDYDEPPADGPDGDEPPVIDSPSISVAVEAADGAAFDAGPDDANDEPQPRSRMGRALGRMHFPLSLPPLPAIPLPGFARHYLSLPIACVAMAALSLSLVVWRTDVVRLMPQTAAFFRTIGLAVNLRGLTIENVKVTSETVDGKPVLIIEGFVADVASKPLQVPRLRFVVHDAKGTEIYGWNAVIEQTTLQPGERAPFTSRLASPPEDTRSIAVRFFNRRDIGA